MKKYMISILLINMGTTGIAYCMATTYQQLKEEFPQFMKKGHLDEPLFNGKTALMVAVENDDKQLFDKLVTKANPNIQNKQQGLGVTPLMYSTYYDDLHYTEQLLKAGADPDMTDVVGNTALHHAVIRRNFPAVQLLLRNSADPNIRNNNGHTPLMLAAATGQMNMVQALMQAGANRLLRDNDGITAHEKALNNRHFEIMKFLERARS